MIASQPKFDSGAWAMCLIGACLLAATLLPGCGSTQAAKKEPAVVTSTAQNTDTIRDNFYEAMKYVKAGKYDLGVDMLGKVSKQVPDNPVPYIDLALAYENQGNNVRAEENFKLALKVSPDNPVASNEYALFFRKNGQFALARKIYEQSLNKYPDFAMAHKNLGILCDIYLQDKKCALEHYQKYSLLEPADDDVKIWISVLQ